MRSTAVVKASRACESFCGSSAERSRSACLSTMSNKQTVIRLDAGTNHNNQSDMRALFKPAVSPAQRRTCRRLARLQD